MKNLFEELYGFLVIISLCMYEKIPQLILVTIGITLVSVLGFSGNIFANTSFALLGLKELILSFLDNLTLCFIYCMLLITLSSVLQKHDAFNNRSTVTDAISVFTLLYMIIAVGYFVYSLGWLMGGVRIHTSNLPSNL